MPQLDVRQVYFWNAYQQLTGSRRVSMSGALPIPISEIRAYCELFKIHDVEDIESLLNGINSLDQVYLDYVAEKSKTK
jgi:hypothetical protein